MRKLPLLLLLALCLQIAPAISQNQAFKNAIHAKLNFNDYGLLFDNKLKIGQGFEFAYFRNIAPALNVGVPLKLALAKLPGSTDANTVTASLDVQFRLENMKSTAKFIPFLLGGAGYIVEKGNSHAQFPFGVGVHFRLSPFAFINLQGEFRKALIDDRDNLQIGIGYVYMLHKSENKPVPEQMMLNDMDKDGTPDSLDVCPTLAGPPISLGCPDSDNDGLGDSADYCPNDAGPLQTNGCPDYDADGFADKDDDCPTDAGTLHGCPDNDQDGVSNKDDKCPDEKGAASNKGCPESSDADGDGVADEFDLCPDKAGTIGGCPDTDGDGTADNVDLCPDQAGRISGCPDGDGDGVPDNVDLCPDKAGPNNGCPDSDGDGIADNFDNCPEQAGTVKNNGCPEKANDPDEDGDGVADKNDPCPDKAGTFNGCPDSDEDGVADNLDKCPDIAGVSKNNGCPEIKDKDGDGVPDSQDKCPTEAGTASNKGCPEVKDRDRDGVVDDQDPCPDKAGTLGGCPDSDKDGVADEKDPCPDKAGTLGGCPDADRDGVADDKDPCPDNAGTLGGCPDTDEDGVADNLDKCPDIAGTSKNNGCPEIKDADKDGIPDSQDKCPTEPGTEKNKGCPEVKDADKDGVPDAQDPCPDKAGNFGGCPDSDGDNVADNVDKCPNTVGTVANFGCPEEKKEITEVREKLATAARAVQFESAKAILKDQSYDVLDEVVTIMRQNPTYSLSISGYTDDVGDDQTNFRLSQDRAKACYDYLIFRGVKAERIRHTGFGEARPIASNNTAEGREQNRRVEFELIVE